MSQINTFRVNITSRELGFLSYVDSDGQVVFCKQVTRLHTTAAFDVDGQEALPRVIYLAEPTVYDRRHTATRHG
jgi:hypothetical protein